jgi:hypothetical protein
MLNWVGMGAEVGCHRPLSVDRKLLGTFTIGPHLA